MAAPLRLGDVAPNFKASTTQGDIDFHEFIGDKWCVLFSHPKDFTPVCTTELGMAAKLQPEFDRRNVKMIAVSVDDVASHHEWVKDINETQCCEVGYPIIGDEKRTVATLYDMIHPGDDTTLTVRSVFIIDPSKKIKLTLTYPASTGRNFDEILRVIDSLQLTAYHQVATPVNWKHGEDCVVIPQIKTDDIPAKFPKGHTVIKPYLRTTPQPNL
eukprot:TRINITY_DN37264_c0_g1_i1.p1 TRINITY_DN37264_c0_g1~~TRINITY_DN37264_c0_g1_i1.p1  ORF type:complete len:232 (+),score=109.82 TRINITY_DN37264_c0_g1_i1:56-697(+)